MNPVALATFKVLRSHKWPMARRLDRAERERAVSPSQKILLGSTTLRNQMYRLLIQAITSVKS